MAGLSTAPSGGSSSSSSSSSSRLSELLEEQQEPFSLDLYLLDKGCSAMLLDAAAGSGSGTATATSACWPSCLLRLLLSKILHGTAATGATAKKKRKEKLPPASADCRPVDVEKTPSYLSDAVTSPPPPPPPPRAVEEADRVDEEEEGEDDDDDSSKQLSPVSVLEQSTFEQAPKEYAQKAVVIFRELIEAAYKPALLEDKSDNYKFNHGRKRNETSTTAAAEVPAPPPRTRTTGRTTGAASHWEEMFEAELAKVDDLVASDMAETKMWPGDDVRPEQRRRDVGYDVAVAVLEALMEEIAVELTGMDHDDAIDNGGRSGCC